jgi:hypothetical protein
MEENMASEIPKDFRRVIIATRAARNCKIGLKIFRHPL